MILLRRVIGDALRARRQSQHRTLREVSTAANVSLGYLSEIERGQKEASSELLLAICDALGAAQSEVLRDASDTLALAEQMGKTVVPMVDGDNPRIPSSESTFTSDKPADFGGAPSIVDVASVVDSDISVAVCRNSHRKTALQAARAQEGRQVVRAA